MGIGLGLGGVAQGLERGVRIGAALDQSKRADEQHQWQRDQQSRAQEQHELNLALTDQKLGALADERNFAEGKRTLRMVHALRDQIKQFDTDKKVAPPQLQESISRLTNQLYNTAYGQALRGDGRARNFTDFTPTGRGTYLVEAEEITPDGQAVKTYLNTAGTFDPDAPPMELDEDDIIGTMVDIESAIEMLDAYYADPQDVQKQPAKIQEIAALTGTYGLPQEQALALAYNNDTDDTASIMRTATALHKQASQNAVLGGAGAESFDHYVQQARQMHAQARGQQPAAGGPGLPTAAPPKPEAPAEPAEATPDAESPDDETGVIDLLKAGVNNVKSALFGAPIGGDKPEPDGTPADAPRGGRGLVTRPPVGENPDAAADPTTLDIAGPEFQTRFFENPSRLKDHPKVTKDKPFVVITPEEKREAFALLMQDPSDEAVAEYAEYFGVPADVVQQWVQNARVAAKGK